MVRVPLYEYVTIDCTANSAPIAVHTAIYATIAITRRALERRGAVAAAVEPDATIL